MAENQKQKYFTNGTVMYRMFKRLDQNKNLPTVKTRPALKVTWQGLSDNWSTQWVKSWGHAEKVMF